MDTRKSATSETTTRRHPLDWVNADEAAEMLRISTATFLRKVDDGSPPPSSKVLGDRNPRWNIKLIYDAMAGLQSKIPSNPGDLDSRIDEMAL